MQPAEQISAHNGFTFNGKHTKTNVSNSFTLRTCKTKAMDNPLSLYEIKIRSLQQSYLYLRNFFLLFI